MTDTVDPNRGSDDPKFGIAEERSVLIPLRDGIRVAGDLHLPDAPGPHPVLIGFYPYRKDDFMGAKLRHARSYLTERGYASLMVDFRGTGSSEGECPVTFDTRSEGADGYDVVEWAAEEPWCDGSVGIWGISYGGIMALAVAAQQPPHLKAIAPMYGSADLHREFIAPGGCQNCLGVLSWISLVLSLDLAPSTFQDPDERWMEVWRERLGRLDRGDIWPLEWQSHPDHDEYWQAKEIPIEEVEVPTFLIGGWRDIYPEATTDMYGRVSGPKKLLMGPWVHDLPDVARIAPVDWLREMRQFFDQWILGEDAAIADEPPITLYVQGADEWRYENEWPIARSRTREWRLGPGPGPDRMTADKGSDRYVGDPTVGTSSSLWDPLASGIGFPAEQAEDDLRSLTYTTAPLEEDLEITGSPEALLRVTLQEGEELQLVAKLNAVAPDGSSEMITTGWLSAAHAASIETPSPVAVGVPVDYRIGLWATSFAVPKGHRLRLAIACSDFPRVWPLRSNPVIAVDPEGSLLRIPVVAARAEDVGRPRLPSPDPDVNRGPGFVKVDQPRWEVSRDYAGDQARVDYRLGAEISSPRGASFGVRQHYRAATFAARPEASTFHADIDFAITLSRGGQVDVRTRTRFSRTTSIMHGEVSMDGVPVLSKTWRQK